MSQPTGDAEEIHDLVEDINTYQWISGTDTTIAQPD